MSEKGPYQRFIENLNVKNFRLEKKEKYTREEYLVRLMVEIWLKDNPKSFDVVEEQEDVDSYTDYEKALFLEAKLLADQKRKKWTLKQLKEYVPIAEEALSLNGEMAMSLGILASWEFQQKNPDEGLKHLLKILDLYPGAKWVDMAIVRNLYFSRKYKLAIPYIEKIEGDLRRFMYSVTIKIMRPYFWFIFAAYMLAIFVLQLVWPFFLGLVSFLCASIIVTLLNERILSRQYIIWTNIFLFSPIILGKVLDFFIT